jgi:hypothetical protein
MFSKRSCLIELFEYGDITLFLNILLFSEEGVMLKICFIEGIPSLLKLWLVFIDLLSCLLKMVLGTLLSEGSRIILRGPLKLLSEALDTSNSALPK